MCELVATAAGHHAGKTDPGDGALIGLAGLVARPIKATAPGVGTGTTAPVTLMLSKRPVPAAAVVERLLKRNRILPLFAAEIPMMLVVVKPV